MPINMITEQKYEIDYERFRDELMEITIFKDLEIQSLCVNGWLKLLKQADKASVDSFFAPNNMMLLAKEKKEAPETFQKLVKIDSTEMYIHFRVSRIIQLLKMNGVNETQALVINIEEIKARKTIDWTETEDDGIKTEPIIIVPFTIGDYYKYLVVDGNHRIMRAIRNKQKTIKAYCIDAEFLVDSNLLSTQFDKLLYIFQNEVVWMGSCVARTERVDEKKLIAESYIMTRRVCFQNRGTVYL